MYSLNILTLMLRPQNCRSTAFHDHPLGKPSQTHVKDELESDHYLHLQRYKSTRMILRKRLPIAISLQSAISPYPCTIKIICVADLV